MSWRKIVVFTTSPQPAPTVSRMAARFASTRLVWATTSPSTIWPVAGSRAICPAVNRNPLATMPCE
jgi:hypothetical protein